MEWNIEVFENGNFKYKFLATLHKVVLLVGIFFLFQVAIKIRQVKFGTGSESLSGERDFFFSYICRTHCIIDDPSHFFLGIYYLCFHLNSPVWKFQKYQFLTAHNLVVSSDLLFSPWSTFAMDNRSALLWCRTKACWKNVI